MAPGEGFPPWGGTGWLIPNAFGTLPAEQQFDICPAFLHFQFFLSLHSLRPIYELFLVYTNPRPFITLRMFTAMVFRIIVLGDSALKVIRVANVILRG